VRDCKESTCGYYQYLQGTSMAAPHAAGVAALIVSEYGAPDRQLGGLTLPVAKTAGQLADTAVEHACPEPRLFHYTRLRASVPFIVESDALCAGSTQSNGFYGSGIVNAYAAVTSKR